MFLRLDYGKCCQGFREKKIRNGGTVLLAVLYFYVKLVWRFSTLIIPLLIAGRQSIAASIQRLPDSVVKSAEIVTESVDVSGEMIKLSTSYM